MPRKAVSKKPAGTLHNLLLNTSIIVVLRYLEDASGFAAQFLEDKNAAKRELPRFLKVKIGALKDQSEERMREIDAQLKEHEKDALFKKGEVIVRKHTIKLPPLTHELQEADLMHYVALLESGHTQTVALIKDLETWMTQIESELE